MTRCHLLFFAVAASILHASGFVQAAAAPSVTAPDGSDLTTAGNAAPEAGGIAWLDLTVENALAMAGRTGKPVLLDLWAAWCGPCKEMERQIWRRPVGTEIGGKTIPIHVDFDSDYGQKLKRRYNVIGLPCVIVLDPRGNEIDRLLGFDKKDAWIEQIRPVLGGMDPIPGLEKKLAADPENISLRLDIAQRRLFRGDEAGAYREFLHLLALSPSQDTAAQIDFLMGRYLQRVRELPAEALPFWKQIAAVYPETGNLTGAVWWGLDAYKALGRSPDGIKWADGVSASRPEDGNLHYAIASWVSENKLRSDSALAHARKAKQLGVEAEDLDDVIASLSGTEKARR